MFVSVLKVLFVRKSCSLGNKVARNVSLISHKRQKSERRKFIIPCIQGVPKGVSKIRMHCSQVKFSITEVQMLILRRRVELPYSFNGLVKVDIAEPLAGWMPKDCSQQLT